MIQLPAGKREIWPGFTLNLPQSLEFAPGSSYHLKGANGSGKSSFIHRILLPALQDRDDLYILCLEQQMHLQIYALSAIAAIFKPEYSIRNEEDVWRYLWDDLASRADSFPVYVIADEAHQLKIPAAPERPVCLIYSSHQYQQEKARIIEFVQIDSHQSRIDV
jgi:ABC-type dipeptide/oligopeptide/nickel transport system ATPase subunit